MHRQLRLGPELAVCLMVIFGKPDKYLKHMFLANLILFSSLHLPAAQALHAWTLIPDPIDAEIEKIKPRPADSVALASRKCAALADAAKARGVSVLLVGFEGQGGFNADNAWLVYRYLWRITHAVSDIPPELDTSAPVLHRLLLPSIDFYSAKLEILDFPETAVTSSSGGVPQACIEQWLTRVPSARVVLMGHSFGADAAHEVAGFLNRSHLPVHQVYSMDAVARSPAKRFAKPGNVELWTNFYQRNQPPFGAFVRLADSNKDLSSLGVNHRTIVRSAPVIGAIQSQLSIP